MSQTINKSDVPIYGYPAVWIFAALNLVGIFTAGVLIQPKARPGVIELINGIVWALVFSRSLMHAWIGYLENAAQKRRKHHLLDYLPMSFGKEWARIQWAGVVAWAGIFVVMLSAYILWLVLHGIPAPWARYGSVEPDFPVPIQSMATSVFVYLVACGLLLSYGIIRWYRALPSDDM